jgi:hypothetical protein
MNIVITIKNNDKVLLRSAENNYELCRLRNHTDPVSGEITEEWVPFKFFPSLGQALNRVLDLKVKASETRSLAELKAAVEAARAEICCVWDTRRSL